MSCRYPLRGWLRCASALRQCHPATLSPCHPVTLSALLALVLAGCQPRPTGGTTLDVVPLDNNPSEVKVVLRGAGAAAVRRESDRDGPSRVMDVLTLRLKSSVAAGSPPPAMLARLSVSAQAVELLPQVSLTPGRTYEAVFHGDQLSPPLRRLVLEYHVPKQAGTSSSVITAIYPAQPTVPANLLKFYVLFSEPMGEGQVFENVRLLDDHGRPVRQPFNERELWSDGHRRLTLWVHPGRTKRALGLSEALGPVLEKGRSYVLEIRAGLRDQRGRPLAMTKRHPFRTMGADRKQPRVEDWQLDPPQPGARAPLVVRFSEPMDRMLALQGLRVETMSGQPVAGALDLDRGGVHWTFTPTSAWAPGEYQLVAAGDLEDLSGNSLYRAFETRPGAASPRVDVPEFRRAFRVGQAGGG